MRGRNTAKLLGALLSLALGQAGAQETVWPTYVEEGNKAYAERRYGEAEKFFKLALEEAEKFGPGDPRLARSIFNLSELYRARDGYAKGFQYYEQTQREWEKALGSDHADLATLLHNLARLHAARAKNTLRRSQTEKSLQFADMDLQTAERFYKRVLRIREKALGPEHLEVATALNNMAALCYFQGKFAETRYSWEREKWAKERRLGTRTGLGGWGQTHAEVLERQKQDYRRDKYAEAERFYQQTLAIREKVQGQEHIDVATTLNNLAVLYFARGHYDKAEPLIKRSLTIREAVLGPNHPSVAYALDSYAALLEKLDRKGEAAELSARAQAIRAQLSQDSRPN